MFIVYNAHEILTMSKVLNIKTMQINVAYTELNGVISGYLCIYMS